MNEKQPDQTNSIIHLHQKKKKKERNVNQHIHYTNLTCTLNCLNNNDLFSSNTSSPCFPIAILSATATGPVFAHPTLAVLGSLKKSFCNRSFNGRWKLDMYNVTPWTLGSLKDSTVIVSLKNIPLALISPTVREPPPASASPPGRIGDRLEDRRRNEPSVVASAFLVKSLVTCSGIILDNSVCF